MLDDFSREMDTTETKMDNVMKKMAKVLHMSSGTTTFSSFSVFSHLTVLVKACFRAVSPFVCSFIRLFVQTLLPSNLMNGLNNLDKTMKLTGNMH